MQTVVLFLTTPVSGAVFHYSVKRGRALQFRRNHLTRRHECRIPLEEWRKDNYAFAKAILDQPLIYPILFDVEEAEDVSDPEAASDTPTPIKRTRRPSQ